jgi:hypothetical protein
MVIGLVGAFAILYVWTAARLESYGSDTSTYFELARSLRHQHRYWFDFEPHTTYPPGYPLLLAGLMALAGETFTTLVRFSIPIYFAGLLGLYWLVTLLRGRTIAAVVTLLGAVSTVGYFWATVGLHSDVPYFTVSVWALLCVELAKRARTKRRAIFYRVLVALCAAYLVLIRSVGITLVAGLLLWMVYPGRGQGESKASMQRRAWQWLPVALLPTLALAAWMWWTGRHGPPKGTGDYMQSYTQQILKADPHQIDSPNITPVRLPARTIRMLEIRTVNATRTVLNAPQAYLRWYNPICLAFLLVVGLGFLASLVRERTVLDYYVLAYGGVLLLYPFDEGTRYLFPVQLFLVLYGVDGLELLRRGGHRLAGEKSGTVAATLRNRTLFSTGRGLLLAAIVALGAYGISVQAGQNLHPDPAHFTNAKTVQVAEWVKQNTQSSDVIMNDEYAILHRLTGRRTVRFPLFTDPAVITQRIMVDRVDFIVVPQEQRFEYYRPSIMRRFAAVRALHPQMFTMVHTFDWGTVYRVHRAGIAARAHRRPA